MNQLHVGFTREIKLPKGGYFYINDDVPDIPRARIFDSLKHCFNPLRGMDYRKRCEFVDIIDGQTAGKGDNTLTKDTGLDFIAERLEDNPKTLRDLIPEPDKKSSTGHVWAYGKIQRIVRSPVLSRVLCSTDKQFSFNPRSVILARINRAELGDFDALVVGLFFMSHFKGQIVVPDLGFYGRDSHVSLIREGRLIAGANHLGELPAKLRGAVLLMPDKIASGAKLEDAEELASYARLLRGTNGYNDFVQAATA